MIPRRAPATLVASLLALSACAPQGASRSAPAASSAAPSIVLLEPELLGEPVAILGNTVHTAKRDILGSATYDLPMETNNWVEAELDFLVGQRREVIARWLSRGDYYQGFVEGVFRSSGIPTDLVHLGMIESGFLPTARSRVGAMGFWQFMPATARDLGLRIDSDVDERMDPVRSTRAAARHLRGLHRSLGDWSLVAAAYNAGSGRISRAMTNFGTRDFWELAQRGDLAAETRQYVPRLYAMTVIGRDRARWGFTSNRSSSFAFDSIQVEYAAPFDELAKIGGVTVEQLTALNPHLVNQATPSGGYWLWVPAGTGVAMQRGWLASDFRREQGYGSYTVRRGDTLGELADASGVRAARIRELNSDVDFDNLQIGEKLRMPYRVAQELAARPERRRSEESSEESASSGSASTRTHTVESGETLSEIAEEYDVTVAALRERNELNGSTIRVGQELKIPGAARPASSSASSAAPRDSTRTASNEQHVVRNGDSLWTIARQYGSTVAAIQTANHLGDRPIQPGQKLTIPVLN